MKKKMKLLLILLITFIISSCKTLPAPVVLPSDVDKPIAMTIVDGKLVYVNEGDILAEADFYIIINPTTKDHHIHNFTVMTNYAVRLEDYIDLIKEQLAEYK
jgi:hypothetical protein